MKPVGEALHLVVDSIDPLPIERRSLLDAHRAVLAEDIVAGRDLPPFDNSAMDGYAVRAAEVSPGATLPLAGESRAGRAPPPLEPGHAMRIFTGAPLPDGADTVVMQEQTEPRQGRVSFSEVAQAGKHVRRAGSDLHRGAVAVARGARLMPGEIGLLAAQGCATVSVHRRARVAILTTGDELQEVEERVRPGGIVNSNAYMLSACARALGATPWVLPTARDDIDDITAKLRDALQADLVVACGGASVGDHDLVSQALSGAGVQRVFWKVAIKPGKPLLFGHAGRVPVFGLPGNPVSALVTFELFVAPALRAMMGDARPYPPSVAVTLDAPYQHSTGRTEFVRARLERRAEGSATRLLARVHPQQGSGSLLSVSDVDCLVVLPPERARFDTEEPLAAVLLQQLTGSEAFL